MEFGLMHGLSASILLVLFSNVGAIQYDHNDIVGEPIESESIGSASNLPFQATSVIEDCQGLKEGGKWDKRIIKWHFERSSQVDNLIPKDTQFEVINKALKIWSDIANIKFIRSSKRRGANIKITFEHDDHHDGKGFGNGYAHAFPPSVKEHGGEIHFKIDIPWGMKKGIVFNENVNFFIVAAHEIGHALGICHIEGDEDSIMNALITDIYEDLQPKDEIAAQSRYGRSPRINGQWVEWTPWTPAICRPGIVRRRSRACIDPERCKGPSLEHMVCSGSRPVTSSNVPPRTRTHKHNSHSHSHEDPKKEEVGDKPTIPPKRRPAGKLRSRVLDLGLLGTRNRRFKLIGHNQRIAYNEAWEKCRILGAKRLAWLDTRSVYDYFKRRLEERAQAIKRYRRTAECQKVGTDSVWLGAKSIGTNARDWIWVQGPKGTGWGKRIIRDFPEFSSLRYENERKHETVFIQTRLKSNQYMMFGDGDYSSSQFVCDALCEFES